MLISSTCKEATQLMRLTTLLFVAALVVVVVTDLQHKHTPTTTTNRHKGHFGAFLCCRNSCQLSVFVDVDFDDDEDDN